MAQGIATYAFAPSFTSSKGVELTVEKLENLIAIDWSILAR